MTVPFPPHPHTYLCNFFQHLLLWGLESSELEAEVKKERLEGEPWHQPHTRSSPEILQQGWHHSSEVQTPANDKKGVQPEHDKRWDSSALWKIRKSCYKDLNIQFQHYDSLFISSLFPTPESSLRPIESMNQKKRTGAKFSINLNSFSENERIGLTWWSWNHLRQYVKILCLSIPCILFLILLSTRH